MTAGCPHCAGPDGPRSAAGDRCELVVYGPDHTATLARLGPIALRRVVEFWAERTTVHGARPDVGYVLVTADERDRTAHPYGEIYVFKRPPPVALEELNTTPCPFCAEDPGDRLVAEGLGWRAWAAPSAVAAAYSVVLAPMSHRPDLPTLAGWERDALAQLLADLLGRFDRSAIPYTLWVHQHPTDVSGWPNAHLHLEIAATPRPLRAGEMGSGSLLDAVSPTKAAAALRAAAGDAPPAASPP